MCAKWCHRLAPFRTNRVFDYLLPTQAEALVLGLGQTMMIVLVLVRWLMPQERHVPGAQLSRLLMGEVFLDRVNAIDDLGDNRPVVIGGPRPRGP